MPLHLKSTISAALSSSTAEENDKGKPSLDLLMATAREGGNWHRIVAAAAVDLQLEMPGIADAKYLLITTKLHVPSPAPDPAQDPVALQFKLNNVGADPITVAPDDNGNGAMMLTTTGLTALYVTNPDADVGMEVSWLALGD